MMWAGTVRSLSLPDQLVATRLAGCDTLSVTPLNYAQWIASGLTPQDMMSMAADHGIRLDQLDPLTRWHGNWRPEGVPAQLCPIEFLATTPDEFFCIARALRVDRISAIMTGPPGRSDLDTLTEDFARLCDRAAESGVACDLEFIPMWGLPDLATAYHVLQGADRPNSGLVFDLWHFWRGNPDLDLLRTIPGDRIACVQICDAHARPQGGNLLADCLQHRLLPGDGALPIAETLEALGEIGGLSRVGMEIFSTAFDALPATEIGDRCRRAFERLGLAAREPAGQAPAPAF